MNIIQKHITLMLQLYSYIKKNRSTPYPVLHSNLTSNVYTSQNVRLYSTDTVTFSWRSCKNDRSPLHRARASRNTRTQLTTPKIKHSLRAPPLLSSHTLFDLLTDELTRLSRHVVCFSIQRRILSWDKHDIKTPKSTFSLIDSRPGIAAGKSCRAIAPRHFRRLRRRHSDRKGCCLLDSSAGGVCIILEEISSYFNKLLE